MGILYGCFTLGPGLKTAAWLRRQVDALYLSVLHNMEYRESQRFRSPRMLQINVDTKSCRGELNSYPGILHYLGLKNMLSYLDD